MDYDFSDIPIEQQGKKLRVNSRMGISTAYGQLIALIFVPICILAIVGATIVLSETTKAAKAKQEAQAQAILIRYEPAVKKLATIVDTIDGREKAQAIIQSMQIEEHLHRAAVINNNGRVLLTVGRTDLPWPQFDQNRHVLNDLPSPLGDVYGVWAGPSNYGPVWLFVDVENEQLTIARYRVLLAIAVTGLFTILLLLLCLNIYSKRWIAPIYEMRLHLQQTDHTNLYKPMHVVSSGELNLLQRDLVFMLRRLHVSYQELKEYAEQTEDDLRHTFDEMEMQNISIRGARDAAVFANEAKSAFLANISHELRTPLNSIDGFINLLARKHNLSPEQNMYVQTIRKSSAHLLALVNDVLDFSKIEAGKLVLEEQEVDLYAIIYDVVDMMTPLAAEKGIDLAVFYYDDVPTHIVSDELRCKQVLTNLVSNALKFTESGEVLVRVSLAEHELPNKQLCRTEQIVISVQDTGRGVNDEQRENLFKRFSQADKSITRQFGGTGLGLVISKQITKLMGGHIGYLDNITEKIANTGSTFWFSVPTDDTIEQPSLSAIERPFNVIACIEHQSSMQVLAGYLAGMGANLTKMATTAGLLDKLNSQEDNHESFDWVIIDGKEDLEPLLRGIRNSFTSHILAFGYQVELDLTILENYQVQPLYQPINKRTLLNRLNNVSDNTNDQQSWQGKHVLAVDDHMPNLMVLDALLSELDVSVTTVNSGVDAIETFNRKNLAGSAFDLIFMDIQMPLMSGFEATQQIRAIESKHQHTPIIALTAHALADEKDKLLSAGMDDYASKPISHPQLVAIMKKWFDGSQTKSQKTIPSDIQTSQPSNTREEAANSDTASRSGALNLIDWQDALSRSANKPDLAKDVLRMLLDSLPKEKDELQAAWEMADITELRQIVHRIVGGTRYTGVPMLRSVVQKLDQQILGLANDIDVSKAKQMLSEGYVELHKALDALMALDLDEWLAQKGLS